MFDAIGEDRILDFQAHAIRVRTLGAGQPIDQAFVSEVAGTSCTGTHLANIGNHPGESGGRKSHWAARISWPPFASNTMRAGLKMRSPPTMVSMPLGRSPTTADRHRDARRENEAPVVHLEGGDVVDLGQPKVIPALETDRSAAYAVGEPSPKEHTPVGLTPAGIVCSACQGECDLLGSRVKSTTDLERHRWPGEKGRSQRPDGGEV